MSDIPALVAASVESSPLHQALTDPNLKDPLHVAANWWKALLNREELLDVLEFLNVHPAGWIDYEWALALLDDKSPSPPRCTTRWMCQKTSPSSASFPRCPKTPKFSPLTPSQIAPMPPWYASRTPPGESGAWAGP